MRKSSQTDCTQNLKGKLSPPPPPPRVLLAKIYKSINEPVNHLIHQSINLLIMLSLIRERSFLSMKIQRREPYAELRKT